MRAKDCTLRLIDHVAVSVTSEYHDDFFGMTLTVVGLEIARDSTDKVLVTIRDENGVCYDGWDPGELTVLPA